MQLLNHNHYYKGQVGRNQVRKILQKTRLGEVRLGKVADNCTEMAGDHPQTAMYRLL